MKTKSIFSLIAFSLLVIPEMAFASGINLYEYSVSRPSQGGSAGEVKSIDTSYSEDGQFSWSYKIAESRTYGELSNGFFLVVNDGYTPKYDDTAAILYGNFDTGDISVYSYDKDSGHESWQNSEYVGTFSNALSVNETSTMQMVSFSIDVSAINSLTTIGPDWAGVQFNDSLGFWFHPFIARTFQTDSDGEIIDLSFITQSWVDKSYLKTTRTEVPEPSTLLLLLSAAGLAAFRSKRA